MPRPLITAVALAAILVAGAASSGCSAPAGASQARPVSATPASDRVVAAGSAVPGDTSTVAANGQRAAADPSSAGTATRPRQYAVGIRRISLARGGRSLPTTVWYPATGTPAPGARPDARVASGRFPLVIYSHGLTGLPEHAQSMTTRMAAAGFVVAAPEYPYTHKNADGYNAGDVPNQPLDGEYVITQVLALDGRTGDRFAGHLRQDGVGAAGHSAGGFTTAGMLGTRRDPRIKAGVVIGGGSLGGFHGTPANMLYVHGDKDPTVTYPIARSAYHRTPWPKAFLTMIGRVHGDYLGPGAKGFDTMMRTVIDFLRWSLNADAEAKGRLSADATDPGVTRYESDL